MKKQYTLGMDIVIGTNMRGIAPTFSTVKKDSKVEMALNPDGYPLVWIMEDRSRLYWKTGKVKFSTNGTNMEEFKRLHQDIPRF